MHSGYSKQTYKMFLQRNNSDSMCISSEHKLFLCRLLHLHHLTHVSWHFHEWRWRPTKEEIVDLSLFFLCAQKLFAELHKSMAEPLMSHRLFSYDYVLTTFLGLKLNVALLSMEGQKAFVFLSNIS